MGYGTLILLDTHAVLWMLEDSPRLSTNARHAIKQAVEEGPIYIAGISLLEVARLMAANRIETSASLDALLA